MFCWALRFAAFTGGRIDSVMQLKWKDCFKIDENRYRIDLYEAKQGKVVEKAIPEELFYDF
jgi:hypothetical protein